MVILRKYSDNYNNHNSRDNDTSFNSRKSSDMLTAKVCKEMDSKAKVHCETVTDNIISDCKVTCLKHSFSSQNNFTFVKCSMNQR